MGRVFKSSSLLFAAIGVVIAGSASAIAQSGSRNDPPRVSSSGTVPSTGTGQRAQQRPPVAMEGYCPVSILAMHKWVRGDPALRVVYDGRTYFFANEQGKRMFQADPAKYVPALGGDCVVALAKMGKRVPGNIRHAAFHHGRLFLFSNDSAQKMFLREPATYADADLALGGNCPVCRVNMGQIVPGKPDIAAFHNGFRYLFPAAEQRQAFVANPDRYVTATGGSTRRDARPLSGPSTPPPAEPGSGSR